MSYLTEKIVSSGQKTMLRKQGSTLRNIGIQSEIMIFFVNFIDIEMIDSLYEHLVVYLKGAALV